MDLTYSPADEDFRARIRDFLAQHLPAGWPGCGALGAEEYREWAPGWRKLLVGAGLFAPSWPRDYCGGGLSLAEHSILGEEFARAGVPLYPLPTDELGVKLLGPTLLAWGTEEQKSYFLPRTVSGEIRWAQGYSEPEAGSDLFSLRTRARLEPGKGGEGDAGGDWVIDGEKVWQTAGTEANWIFLLARTDPAAGRAKGLSFLLAPVDQPGVRVRPILNLAGQDEFAGFVLDGARTPARNVVGGVNNGARVALTLLGFERGADGMAAATGHEIELRRLMELARQRGRARDPLVRQRIAACYSKVFILRCLGLRALTAGLDGRPPGAESSILKMFVAEYHQEVTELAADILGAGILAPAGQLGVPVFGPDPLGADAASSLSWATALLRARAGTIYGGSSQIQRNTIAEQILGLPREPRAGAAAGRVIA